MPSLMLPLVPLIDHVLLPTAIARVNLPGEWASCAALVDHLLKQVVGKDVLVAVVPLLSPKLQLASGNPGSTADETHPSTRASSVLPSSSNDSSRDSRVRQHKQRKEKGASHFSASTFGQNGDLDLSTLHSVGTLARVRQLTRVPKTGEWVLALEGVSRVAVSHVGLAKQQYYEVAVEELRPSPKNEADILGEAVVVKEFKQAAMQLLTALEASTGSAAARRMGEALEASSPKRAADLLTVLLAPGFDARMAMLNAADSLSRLRLALGLIKATLARLNDLPAPGSSTTLTTIKVPAEQQQAAALAQALALQRLLSSQRPGSGGFSQRGSPVKEDADDEEELAAVMKRLQDSSPPADVLKAAMREFKRLKRSNDQAPGYAMSRVYLETLADLPWNTFATAVPRPSPALSPERASDSGTTTRATDHAETDNLEPGGAKAGSSTRSSRDDSIRAVSEDNEGSTLVERLDLSAEQNIPRLQPHFQLSSTELSLGAARALLDEHHYGLSKVKQRIVQFLAVRRLRGPEARAPILCFVGPPGVGKTSLARSVAQVLGRPFQRISLGGVRDEAEVRGHRRTYVGAMPGRIIQALRRAAVRDPLLLLDEIDKMGADSARGDPAAALLEVLDPEQNAAFVDTYLALPFDLSKVVFLATGNRAATIPPPLLDRMEVISLSGYTLDEKVHIAERHLIPKLLAEHGLSSAQLAFPRPALEAAAAGWTREAGVRQLSQALASICRHVAVHVVAATEQDESASEEHFSERTAEGLPAQDPISTKDTHGSHEEAVSEAGSAHGGQPRMLAAAGHASGCATGYWQPRSPQNGIKHSPGVHALSVGASDGHDGWMNGMGTEGMQALVPATQGRGGQQRMVNAQVSLDEALLEEVLGSRRYLGHDTAHRVQEAGSVAGLVWTEAGGQLQYVECAATSAGVAGRRGALQMTGQVGEVLEESAQIALSWIRAHAAALDLLGPLRPNAAVAPGDSGIDRAVPSAKTDCSCWDVHVHLPAGAIPKDGPSAGITLAVALISLFSGHPVRGDTAMTGELTLRGLVLPIGGVKDKLIAAHQCGIKQVIIPARNMAEAEAELPPAIRAQLQIVPVTRLQEVLMAAFDPPLQLLPEAKL